MLPKLKSEIAIESQALRSDAAEVAKKGIILATVEKIERNLANP